MREILFKCGHSLRFYRAPIYSRDAHLMLCPACSREQQPKEISVPLPNARRAGGGSLRREREESK